MATYSKMVSIHFLILAWIVNGAQAFSVHGNNNKNNNIQAQDYSVGPLSSSPKRVAIVALEPLPLSAARDSVPSTSAPVATATATAAIHRREVFQKTAAAIVASLFAGVRPATAAAAADTDDYSNVIFLKGVVSLLSADYKVNPTDATTTSTPAIYVTCRPDRPDNVPGAILSGTRGKPPPVLAARFENPTFPFEFELGSKDLTMEGIFNESGTGAPILENNPAPPPASLQNVWWNKENLVVSARFDTDGVAATRSPEDLVGRGFWKNGDTSVEVLLTGRGAFGKFATGAKK
jgi:hypothetical protein